eukprot:TRINITY_DN6031_c0_g1_i5.p1 TRINITY_DN6031_c0_g1~~TRINITY_DN6031_c0_g1_i5.p1  ORF type:complete len:263 (+),score=32.13 TRINITY_DN6031_c0_g1_i5:110-898(+)
MEIEEIQEELVHLQKGTTTPYEYTTKTLDGIEEFFKLRPNTTKDYKIQLDIGTDKLQAFVNDLFSNEKLPFQLEVKTGSGHTRFVENLKTKIKCELTFKIEISNRRNVWFIKMFSPLCFVTKDDYDLYNLFLNVINLDTPYGFNAQEDVQNNYVLVLYQSRFLPLDDISPDKKPEDRFKRNICIGMEMIVNLYLLSKTINTNKKDFRQLSTEIRTFFREFDEFQRKKNLASFSPEPVEKFSTLEEDEVGDMLKSDTISKYMQ